MNIETKIEAILFYNGGSMSLKEISNTLEISLEEIKNVVDILEKSLIGRGIVLVKKEDEIMLRTSPEVSELIQKITKEELSRDLGRAGLETLSIILYKNPIGKKEIEYIRGVKSSFILRNLLIRGLVERITDPKDARSHLYKPTFDALSFLGISDINQLPDYEKTVTEIKAFQEEKKENDDLS